MMQEQIYLRPIYKKGKKGSWWWGAYDESAHCWMMCPAPGFASKADAEAHYKAVSNAEWLNADDYPAPNRKRRWWLLWVA